MKWQGDRRSTNVRMSGGKAAGGGIFGIIIGLVLWLVFGVNPMTAFQTGQSVTTGSSNNTQPVSDNSRDTQFVETILANTEDVWDQIFKDLGGTYKKPTLVLFNGRTNSACGSATSATGPFYCPGDQQLYLDTSFFAEMRNSLGISGDQQESANPENQDKAGDFAQAYVIAHEVGHHVQTLLGISQKVNEARRQLNETQANQLSVRQELQADCFAGVWANYNQQRVDFLEPGDIDEALHAASQIGDDRLTRGTVSPDNFTHGTSQQRVNWFTRGLNSGNINSCDTFSGSI